MAAQAANKYTTCSNCKQSAEKLAKKGLELYICRWDECEDYGLIYCRECGILSHTEIEDHKFDIMSFHIKSLSLTSMQENMKVSRIYHI